MHLGSNDMDFNAPGGGSSSSGSSSSGLKGTGTVLALPARAGSNIIAPNTLLMGRVQLTAYAAMSGVRFHYGGLGNSDILPDNEVLIQAALEYNGAIWPVTFRGSQWGELDRHGWLNSDPVPVDIPQGATYYCRTRVLAPNNLYNLNPLNGYTTLAADIAAGVSSLTTTHLPDVRKNGERFRIAQGTQEVVEVARWAGTGPYTATLRAATANAHTAAGSVFGQGVWTNREVYSDQGEGFSNSNSFDIFTGTFPVDSAAGSQTTTAAANIGDQTIQINGVNALRGQTFTLDTAGNAETVSIRTIVGTANPYTAYLTAPLTKAHGSGVALANTIAAQVIPVPTMVSADFTSGAPAAIVLVGDSIAQGTGNYFRQWEGWPILALESSHPLLNLAKSGESAQQFANNTNGIQRRRYLDLGRWMLLAYGTNDIYSGRSLAQTQGDIATIVGWARSRGMRVAMATLLPRTTSSDGWTTTGGQTISNVTFDGIRKQLNSWIRGGAGGLNDLLIEAADQVESARDSGLWKADTTTGPYTVDGLHPSYAGHQLIAAAVTPSAFTN